MKKIKKMLVLVVSMTIILCGCDKVPSEDTPMTNRLFNVCAEIDYGENSISCNMTRLGDGIWKSEINFLRIKVTKQNKHEQTVKLIRVQQYIKPMIMMKILTNAP